MSWFDKLFGEEKDSNEDYLNNRNKRRQKANQSDEQDTLLPQNNDVYDRPRGKFRFPMHVIEESKQHDNNVDQNDNHSNDDTYGYRDESQVYKQVDNKRHRRRREDVRQSKQHQTKNSNSSQYEEPSHTKKSRVRIQTEVLKTQSAANKSENTLQNSDFKATQIPSAIFGTKKRRQLKNGVIPTNDEADPIDDDHQQNTTQQEATVDNFKNASDSEETKTDIASEKKDDDINATNTENDVQIDNEMPKAAKKDNTININNFYASQIVEEIRRERERKVLKKRQFKKALQEKRKDQDDVEKDNIQKAIDEMYAKQAQQYIGDSSLSDNYKQTSNDDTVEDHDNQNEEANVSLNKNEDSNHFKYEEVDLNNVSDVHTVQDEDVEVSTDETESLNTIDVPDVTEQNNEDTTSQTDNSIDSSEESGIDDAQYRELTELSNVAEDNTFDDDLSEGNNKQDFDNGTVQGARSDVTEENNSKNETSDTYSNDTSVSETHTESEKRQSDAQINNNSTNKVNKPSIKKNAKPFNVVMTPSDKKRMMDARKSKNMNVPNTEPKVAHTTTSEDIQAPEYRNVSNNDEINTHITATEDTNESLDSLNNSDVETNSDNIVKGTNELQTDHNETTFNNHINNEINSTNESQIKETRTIRRGPSLKLPDVSLLDAPEEHEIDDSWIDEKKQELNDAFYYFNVPAEVQSVTEGPSVTRFELSVEKGVKVSRITALQDDIKMALAAKDIRIEAPIPGTSLVGIEVPNQSSTKVNIRSIIDTEEFKNTESKLTVAMGYRINNKPLLMDIAKTPHALIAGATGSGKSVCINSILLSLIYKNHPEELKLLLIDPKMVELAPYNDLPHLVSPVITDVKAATQSLKWAVDEMERRYKLFAKYHVRNITAFNKKANYEDRMPKIVIVIDELADLMMMAPQDVEQSIARIAQKARACGIHMLVATQRPSVNVITGLIKANIPTRIAFMVSSSVDSRTILDSGGAERLLGYGDMLYLGSGMNKPIRVQGTFVSDEEIDDVVDFVKQQRDPEYLFEEQELIKKTENAPQDDLFNDVCVFMVQEGHISTSLIQRHFQIGYNRAARIVDQLEQLGYISESNGSKPRDVYLTETDLNELNK